MPEIKKSASIHFLREGKPATSYWLVPSATSVRYNPDTGVWSPSSVSCARMQQTGSGLPESSTYGALIAQYLDANGSILTQTSISNGQAASFGAYGINHVPIMAIRFLWQASSQLASVTVQALTDGTEGPQGPQGNPGENGIGVAITPSTVTYDPANGNTTVNVVVIVNDGELAGPPDGLSKLYTSSDMSTAVNESVTQTSGKWSYDKAIDAWQGRYRLYFSEISTLEQSLWFNVTKGDAVIKCCLPVSRLQRGEPGPQGAIAVNWKWDDIVRNGGLPGGRQFEDGSEGCTYLDSVLVGEAQYRCVATHAYAVGENPQTDSRWEMYSIQYNSVATDLLMARMASINFLAGNTLSILNADNDVVARLQAGSGIFPVLYIAPVRKPVRVETFLASGLVTNPWVKVEPGSSFDVASFGTVRTKFVTYYSDGTTEENTVNPWFSASETGSYTVLNIVFTPYEAASESATQGHSSYDAGCTTEQMPHLMVTLAVIKPGNVPVYLKTFVGQWSRPASDYGQSALIRLFSNGFASFGSENGRQISINPEAGELAVTDGKGSMLVIDGCNRSDIIEMVGSTKGSQTLKSSSYDNDNFPDWKRAYDRGSVRKELLNFETDDECTAKITVKYRVTLYAGTSGGSGLQPTSAQGSGAVALDGSIVAGETSLTASIGQTVNTGVLQVTTMRNLPPGKHKVEAIATLLAGFNNAHTECEAKAMVELTYRRKICRVFGNGIAIGSSTSNYFMLHDSDGCMTLDFRNSSGYGLKIDSTGVFAVGPDNTTKNLLT